MSNSHEEQAAADAEKLRKLERRIAEMKTLGERPTPGSDKFHQANQAWRMVTELVAGLVIGFGVGYGLDAVFGTLPIFLVVFTIFGFIAGIKTVMRTAGEMTTHQAAGPLEEDEGNNDRGQ